MGAWEIVTIIAATLVVVGVAAASVVRKLKGKPSCCSDCSRCPYHKDCGK